MIGDTVDANVKWWNLDYIQSGSLLHEQVSNVDVSLVPEPKSEKDGHGYYHEYLQENAKAAQHVPQPRSGRPVAIRCGLLPPVDGFAGILGHTLSEVVGKGKVERAPGIPGQCRLMVPERSFFPVVLYALAVLIPITQGVLRCGISGMGQFL